MPARHRNRKRSAGCLSSFVEGTFFASVFAVLLLTALSVNLMQELPGWHREGRGPFRASAQGCEVSSRFPKKVLQWCELITFYAQENDLDPDLVAALIWQESGGHSQAYSRSGAVGLMQVMPRDGIAVKFQCKNGPCFSDRPTILELKDPEFNIRYGTRMLRSLIDRHQGDLRKALKAYGPMDVDFHYADTVLALYNRYGSPRLE
jgi:soluble lytic murein transglycosylase-like protein